MIRVRDLTMVFALYACAAIVMTLPLAQHPTRVLPSDLIDTLLNTWIIGWDAERLRHGLSGVWDAPIFFPYRNSLAFSENLFGLAVLVAPIYWVTTNAILTYNAAFVLSFALAGFGMYLLAHSLTGSRGAAIVSGAYYAFCPYRVAQIVHIQMIATGWIPVGLYGLHQYFHTRRRRWLALFAAAYVLQVTSNMYVAYMMAIPAAIVIAHGLMSNRAQWRSLAGQIFAAAIFVLVALAPIAMPYYRARVDYRNVRNSVEIEMGSADLRSYVSPIDSVGVWRWLPAAVPLDAEKALFPGVLIVALSGGAAVHALRHRGAVRRWLMVYGAIAVVAAVISFGPHVYAWGVKLTDHGPYDWLWWIVPGWDGMRVPARFGIIVCLSLSAIGALGASLLLRRLGGRAQAAAAAVGVIFILAEGWIVPMRTVAYSPRGRPEDREVSQWLAQRPSGGVLDMPMVTGNFEEVSYQYATLLHHHPLVNGMSGYNSGLQRLFRNPDGPLYDWARPAAVARMLRAIGVRYVVLHHGDYTRAEQNAREEERTSELLLRSGQVASDRQLYGARVFELEAWTEPPVAAPGAPIDPREFTLNVNGNEERAAALVDGDRDTRWFAEQDGGSFIDVSFKQPTGVAAIELTLAERSLTDYPRELLIEAYDDHGTAQTLYAGSPYPEFLVGFVRDGFYPRVTLPLPENRGVRLRIRQTAAVRGRWWSIHELRLWKRSSAAAYFTP